MRFLGLALATLIVLFIAPAAFAQIDPGDGIDNMTGISDGCGDTMNPDDCMFSDTSSTICKKAYCPACGFNENQTASICFTLQGQYGYCSCTGGGVTIDKHGNKVANCNASGSCSPPR
jgi:hypothetical protein